MSPDETLDRAIHCYETDGCAGHGGCTSAPSLQHNSGPPGKGGTVGSVINHVGFVVNNVQERVAEWKAAGVPVLPGNNNRLDQAPSIVTWADGRGLLSYAAPPVDYRPVAGYVDRILRGAKPGELPVQVPSKFELVINLKTDLATDDLYDRDAA